MRQMFVGLAVAAFVVALGAPAFAATETVKGRIVDVTCYKMEKSKASGEHMMSEEDAKNCALECAKEGKPMALLTAEGEVYELTGGLAADKNAKIIPHVAHVVEVTGDVTEKDGKMTIAADSLKMISK